MIVKELDPSQSTDKYVVAGRRAEEQMAFYLRRSFAETDVIRVLNDLRLERNGEIAQMDHLLVHRYGMVIIESKSVSTQVEVNARDEWRRSFGGRWQGMPSPVLQAKRQGDLLKRLLADHSEDLLDKFLFGLVQGRFGMMALDVLVAVSDQGQIKRQRKDQAPEVMKADQIPERITELVRNYDRMTSALNLSMRDLKEAPRSFNDKEIYRITAFLKSRHKPRPFEPAVVETSAPTPEVRVDAVVARVRERPHPAAGVQPTCRHCGSDRVAIAYGYSYYFTCGACSEGTPIDTSCDTCGTKARIRKNREQFFKRCTTCDVETLFFVNPATPPAR